jgi:hypothetical protein
MTGKSKDNIYSYLFTCQVKNMNQVENDIKNNFITLREEKSKEIYFYTAHWFNEYVKFIKSHKLFMREIFIRTDDKKQIVQIIKKTTPTLKERDITHKDLLHQAKKVKNDEFYTRYEDIEKEIAMCDKDISQMIIKNRLLCRQILF